MRHGRLDQRAGEAATAVRRRDEDSSGQATVAVSVTTRPNATIVGDAAPVRCTGNGSDMRTAVSTTLRGTSLRQ